MNTPIDLYTWVTPNGYKASIMLEETEIPYRAIPVNIMEGDQFAADFLKISPNNKIPAIMDHDESFALMESGAILIYLADKAGMLLPTDKLKRTRVIEWLMFQVGGFGPMLGQAHHFTHFNPEKSDYARERYGDEAKRLYGVVEKRLQQSEFLGGDDYSIADIAAWPWAARFGWQGIDLNDYPAVLRWYTQIAARPAVQRGYEVPKKSDGIPLP